MLIQLKLTCYFVGKSGYLMSVHEKIKRVRQANGWTQEYLAEKLEMSVNGYGDIERGDSDIKYLNLSALRNYWAWN